MNDYDYDYDSDSSGADDVETNVLLGYASKEPTSDDFSQLGGHPTWLDASALPSSALVKCKICSSFMSLLLQLNGDLPQSFPGHERRLYIWACRSKSCRRKIGSVRAFRAARQAEVQGSGPARDVKERGKSTPSEPPKPAINLGETLFGVKSPTSPPANPFSTKPSGNETSNPFASASSLAAKPAQTSSEADTTLPATFAQKARISLPEPEAESETHHEPWPDQSSFPAPYPAYHVDADKEYIDAEPANTSSNVRVEGSGSDSAAEDKVAFESTMDKTFQRFADRLAQNPEQILRYEFAGHPLLYSKTDAVGKLFADLTQEDSKIKLQSLAKNKIRRCQNCGHERVFELQLTPHAITELEADELSLEGMDWGTILLGVCGKDCQQRRKKAGEMGYVEEWVGVQWEELAGKR